MTEGEEGAAIARKAWLRLGVEASERIDRGQMVGVKPVFQAHYQNEQTHGQ